MIKCKGEWAADGVNGIDHADGNVIRIDHFPVHGAIREISRDIIQLTLMEIGRIIEVHGIIARGHALVFDSHDFFGEFSHQAVDMLIGFRTEFTGGAREKFDEDLGRGLGRQPQLR